MSKDGRQPEPRVVANGVQAAYLTIILPLTLPERRVPVSAAFLGLSTNDVYEASGVSSRMRSYYRTTVDGMTDVPSWWLTNLAKTLRVPFMALWDEEALENPRSVFLANMANLIVPARRGSRAPKLRAVVEKARTA